MRRIPNKFGMANIDKIKSVLRENITSSSDQAKRFFKTTPGSYSEKDEFIGVTVPVLRKIAKSFQDVSRDILGLLLHSKINEERLLALLILIMQYHKASVEEKQLIYAFYLDNTSCINNWNLVDASAHLIVGAHILDKDKTILTKLAESQNLWERRISIVATWYFIRQNNITLTFDIAKLLLKDDHDLIHKATGWMLREAGKRNKQALINFLNTYACQMPRTMLRYSIERFDIQEKQYFLKIPRREVLRHNVEDDKS